MDTRKKESSLRAATAALGVPRVARIIADIIGYASCRFATASAGRRSSARQAVHSWSYRH
jgi:hypothetical protein